MTPNIQDKSRMREIRPYGSVRGASGNRCPYRDPETPENTPQPEVGQALPPALPTPKPAETTPAAPPAAPVKVYRNLWTPRQDRKVS